jgi:hypothetical protein
MTTRVGLVLLILAIGCGQSGQHTNGNTVPSPGRPVPPVDFVLGRYLDIRGQLLQESPQVVLCENLNLINPTAVEQRLLANGFQVHRATGSQDCTRDFPSDGARQIVFIVKIERTDTLATLNARVRRAHPHPRGWDEVYTIRPNLMEGIELRPTDAID